MNSSRVSASQIRSIYLLLGECRELGDDLLQWRSHFWRGVAKLIDADLILHAAVNGSDGTPSMQSGGAWGFQNGFNAKGWFQFAQENPMSFKSEMTEFMLTRATEQMHGLVATRQEIMCESQWEASFDKNVVADMIGTSAAMQSYQWLRGKKQFDVCVITRGIGRKQFAEREAAVMHLLHAESAKQIGGALAGYDDPQPSRLPPRVRQVLQCMLEGDSDKQIAVRMGISTHTVNQYTKFVFRHFSVSGRLELLARWVKRGWGGNMGAWRTPDDVLEF